MRRRVILGVAVLQFATVFATADLAGRACAGDPAGDDAKPPGARAAPPDAVLAEFMAAMYVGDQDRILGLTLPNPEEALLWSNRPESRGAENPPREAFEAAKKMFAARMPFKRLKVGDKVTLPGGRVVVMDEQRVNENRVEIMGPGAPVPVTLVRRDGEWLVDASAIIASRKAATEAKRRADPASAAKGPPAWTTNDAQGQLGKETAVAGFKMRPPKEFTLRELAGPPNLAIMWEGAAREDGTKPRIIIQRMPLAEAELTRTLERQLHGVVVQALAPRRENMERTAFERGEVNGRAFVRTRWSGTSKPTASAPARTMHGLAYITLDGTDAVLLMSEDAEPHQAASLKVSEAAILSIHK